MVSLADLTSTIREAAGAPAQPTEDGRPLQLFAQDPTYGVDRPILLEGSTAMLSPDFPVDAIGRFYTGVRWKHYVYAEYENGPRELYDLTQDPYELDNLYRPAGADEPPLPVQLRLAAWLATHRDCVGADECDQPVPAPPG